MFYAHDLILDDPYFLNQWALNNISQDPPHGTADADIDAPQGWDITTGDPNIITIAILDTGIPMKDGTLSHPDLNDQNKIILGPDLLPRTMFITNLG